MKRFLRIASCAVLIGVMAFAPRAWGADGSVTILTLNHMVSQLLPVSEKVNRNTVFMGGLSHAAGVVQEVRRNDPEAILVVGGESVFGTMWRYFKGLPEFTSLSSMDVQAGTIGKHELDYGWEHFREAFQYIRFPMILSNVAVSAPEFVTMFKKNHIVPYGGLKVGFFALVSQASLLSAAHRSVEMQIDSDLVGAARAMVDDLKAQGADVVVMLSNLTELENNEVAKDVSGIHAIVGRGNASRGEPDAAFVTGPGGWLTAMAWGGTQARFVGELRIETRDGRITEQSVSWRPLTVTATARADQAIIDLASEYEAKLNTQMERVLGLFRVPVDTRKRVIRSREMPMGNFTADALRWRFKTDIGVMNAGGIRGDRIFPSGEFSEKTIFEMFPFGNGIDIVTLTGRALRQMMEISASALAAKDDGYDVSSRVPDGGFLQVSGLRLIYDLSRPPTTFKEGGVLDQWGSRLQGISVQKDGEWVDVDDNATYTIAVSDYIAGGGDRYFIMKEARREATGFQDIEIVLDYIRTFENGRLDLANDGRITIQGR